MKKSLIALAVASSFSGAAFAQSAVTLSGFIKTGVAFTHYGTPTSGVCSAATSCGSATELADGSSRIILSGTEDVGGGLKGIFQIDSRFRSDGPTTQSPTSAQ